MSGPGQKLTCSPVGLMSALPRRADIVRPPRLRPHQLRDRPNEPSFTLVLVRSGSVPKAIEFFFYRPANVVRA
jgi:hypothetical protein